MIDIILTIYLILVVLITFIGSLPIVIIGYIFLKQKDFGYMNECLGSIIFRSMTLLGFWTFKIIDLRKHKDFTKQYVIVSNHVSFIDTLILWQLPLYKKFIMAEKYTKIPIFGQLCKAGGNIFVDKFNRDTTIDAVDKAYNTIKDGSSIVIFSEGMRSPDPNILLPFKTGAFRLAQKANIPILPITIKGTGKACPVGGICHPGDIEMIIGDPIEVSSDYTDIKKNPAINQVREFILKQLNKK